MERIIRSNAVKISLEAGNCDRRDKLSTESEFVPPLVNIDEKKLNLNPHKHAKIYRGANSEFLGGMPPSWFSTSANTSNNANSDNRSALQAMFNQPPSAIPSTVLLGSIAFFAIVLTWIWSLSIEEISQLQGKFVPSIDSQKVFKVTKQEVTMTVKTQAQQNHSPLLDEVEAQKQQLTSIQTRLNHLKALMGGTPPKSTPNPQSIGQLDVMYAVESSSCLMLSNNTAENQFFALSTADNTIDSLKLNRSAIQGIQSLLPKSPTQQQIQKLAKDVIQLQSKLIETKNRINAIELNLKPRLFNTSSREIIDKPKKPSTREVFPSTQMRGRESTSLVLMTTLPNRQAQLLRPGDRVQIQLDTYRSHYENTIFGKVSSIVPEPNTKISGKNHAAQFQIVMEQDPPIKRQLYPLKANQIATAKIISRHRIAEMFFDTNN